VLGTGGRSASTPRSPAQVPENAAGGGSFRLRTTSERNSARADLRQIGGSSTARGRLLARSGLPQRSVRLNGSVREVPARGSSFSTRSDPPHRDRQGTVAHLRKAGRIPRGRVRSRHRTRSPISLDAHRVRARPANRSLQHDHSNSRSTARMCTACSSTACRIDPRNRHLLHVDLFELKKGEEVTVEIQLHTVGESYAVDRLGGNAPAQHRPHQGPRPAREPAGLDRVLRRVACGLRTRPSTFETCRCRPASRSCPTWTEVVAKVAAPHVIEEPVVVAAEGEAEGAEAAAATEEKTGGLTTGGFCGRRSGVRAFSRRRRAATPHAGSFRVDRGSCQIARSPSHCPPPRRPEHGFTD